MWPPPRAPAGRSSPRACSTRSASATSCARCSSRWFTTPLQLDEDEDIGRALSTVAGLDAAAVVAAIDAPATLEAYEQDRSETRTAEGGATDYQGKARQTDGPVRYSAPSLVFESDAGVRFEGGGFQPLEAYDVLIANLDRGLERHPPAQSPLEALAEFPSGLVTEEVAAIMAPNNMPPDRAAAERALVELLGRGRGQAHARRRRRPLAAGVNLAGGVSRQPARTWRPACARLPA